MSDFICINNDVYRVKKITSYNDGFAISFKRNGILDYAFSPKDYLPYEIGNHRFFFRSQSNDSICQVFLKQGKAYLVPSDPDCPGEDLSNLIRTHIMTDGLKAYKSKSWLLWVIIPASFIMLVIIGVIAYKVMA